MVNLKIVRLTDLKSGQSGVVVDLVGGKELARRLNAMGLKKGKSITKVSGMFFRGPVTVKVGQTQVSLGHGMAYKIKVTVKAGE